MSWRSFIQHKRTFLKTLFGASTLMLPAAAHAHEAYVLPQSDFWNGLASPFSKQAFAAMTNKQDVIVTIKVVVGVFLVYALNAWFRRSNLGKQFHAWLEKGAVLGPLFIRVAIASAFFFSALSESFLGPELSTTTVPFGPIIRTVLLTSSFLFAVGFLTEIAAIVSIMTFLTAFFFYGPYLLTYLNYFGELIVLGLFGMRVASIDQMVFGKKIWLQTWKQYDTTIVRICYGLALIYAAITVKLLHPDLTMEVVNNWNLTRFHWLFPQDPLLVALGAGLAEAAIGIFILIGFELRLTVFISLFYITLSLFFFRELVWPHLMLYGISLNLLVQPETWTVDQYLFPNKKTKQKKTPTKKSRGSATKKKKGK